MTLSQSSSSSLISIKYSEDSLAVACEATLRQHREAMSNGSSHRERPSPSPSEEEPMIHLQLNNDPSPGQHTPLSLSEQDELRSALTMSQNNSFMYYGNSSLGQIHVQPSPLVPRQFLTPTVYPNVQANLPAGEELQEDERKLPANKSKGKAKAKPKPKDDGKKDGNKSKRIKRHYPLEPPLNAFRYEHRHRIVFGEEDNPDTKKGDVGPY